VLKKKRRDVGIHATTRLCGALLVIIVVGCREHSIAVAEQEEIHMEGE